jgi:hypothetical protein
MKRVLIRSSGELHKNRRLAYPSNKTRIEVMIRTACIRDDVSLVCVTLPDNVNFSHRLKHYDPPVTRDSGCFSYLERSSNLVSFLSYDFIIPQPPQWKPELNFHLNRRRPTVCGWPFPNGKWRQR